MGLQTLTLVLFVAISAAAGDGQQNSIPPSQLLLSTGVVKTVGRASFTLDAPGSEVAFAVTLSTRFIRKGLASDLVLRMGPRRLSEFVQTGDKVAVAYRRSANLPTAVEVRVVERGPR